MSSNNNQESKMKGAIEQILQAIKEKEDPDELNRIKVLVKKNVPIFLRSYFSAYLFKQCFREYSSTQTEYTTLFISVGKNRRVFPQDLLKLFIRTLKIDRKEIGEIKVLDNYSFLDISLDRASEAISKLSGINFRGRRLNVNLARKKGDDKNT